MPGETHNEHAVYQCTRGRDIEPGLLYMIYEDGSWRARQINTPVATAAHVQGAGYVAFRAATAGDDVIADGQHMWECYNNDSGTFWPPSRFMTTGL